jgi:hypothetical protein
MKGLIVILSEGEEDGLKFRRLDTREAVNRCDFKVLHYSPTLYQKPVRTIPQQGVFAHCTSLDFNEIPSEANAVLLSKRSIVKGNMEVYAGSYCYLK